MKRGVAIGILLAIMIGSIIAGLTFPTEPYEYAYSGKVLLTDQEYTNFKEILAREDVSIFQLKDYSTSPHLVIFSICTPLDVELDFGNKVTQERASKERGLSFLVAFTTGWVVLVLVLTYAFWRPNYD